jgi:hypothetical protein
VFDEILGAIPAPPRLALQTKSNQSTTSVDYPFTPSNMIGTTPTAFLNEQNVKSGGFNFPEEEQ